MNLWSNELYQESIKEVRGEGVMPIKVTRLWLSKPEFVGKVVYLFVISPYSFSIKREFFFVVIFFLSYPPLSLHFITTFRNTSQFWKIQLHKTKGWCQMKHPWKCNFYDLHFFFSFLFLVGHYTNWHTVRWMSLDEQF